MIIGTGMIAKVFHAYENQKDFLIFAAGVSNSQEVDPKEFLREKKLLIDAIEKSPDKTLVYFSSCSTFDPSLKNMPYVAHKKEMETIISKQAKNYYILRLPIVVGKTNNTTIVNYLYQKINKNEPFVLWSQSTRNLIDAEDVFKVIDYIITNGLYKNQVLNIATPYNVSVKKIVKIIENTLQKKAIFSEIEKGAAYEIDISPILPVINSLNIKFTDKYQDGVIKKYFKNPSE